MCKLDPKSLHIRAYTDAPLSTNPDYSAQLGYIVSLPDKHDKASVLHYASYRSRWVAQYVLGSENYAFADAFDFAYHAKTDLEKLLDRRVSLSTFTDSKSLFNFITKCSQTQGRRLLIDLQAVRDAYTVDEVRNLGFIRSPNNPANGLTKIGKSHTLYHMLSYEKCDFVVEQWVFRCQNGSTSANYLSTAPIFYLHSYINKVMHPSRDTTSMYMRSNENASLQTVPAEIMENFSIPLMEYVGAVSFSTLTALQYHTIPLFLTFSH